MEYRIKASTVRRYADIAAMWRAGATTEEIAESFSLNFNTATCWIRRARLLLGEATVPHRSKGPKIGTNMAPSALDQLAKPGDVATGAKADLGSRPNVHQNARTRGWAVRVKDCGLTWEVTALAKVPTLAHDRAVKRKASMTASVPVLSPLQ